jgi:hypothetical protein
VVPARRCDFDRSTPELLATNIREVRERHRHRRVDRFRAFGPRGLPAQNGNQLDQSCDTVNIAATDQCSFANVTERHNEAWSSACVCKGDNAGDVA